MPLIKYSNKRISSDRLQVIHAANQVISAYQAKGYDLTLRQLYYQFIAKDLLPDSRIDSAYNAKNGLPPDTKNTEKNYKWLGGVLDDGRMVGIIDWDAIVDRTRNLRENSHWENPAEIVHACAEQFRVNLWENQDVMVEVFIEKDALIGVIENVCQENDVPYFSCRGYISQSEMWRAAQRAIMRDRTYGQRTIILHLGDHDPSGLDMTRDIQDRFGIFGAGNVEIRRLALNMNQVEEQTPPPNPAKNSDSRFQSYTEKYGDDCWELDALEPEYLEELIQEEIDDIRNEEIWNEAQQRQEDHRKELRSVSINWEQIVEKINEDNEED